LGTRTATGMKTAEEDIMAENGVIEDSNMDFAEAIAGTAAPREVIETLRLISVRYFGFDGLLHQSQLIIHRELAADLGEIFVLMETLKFPVAGVIPIVRFGWSDEASMAADNTSSFNYRTIAGTDRLSSHATGRAIDINPRQNPAVYPDGRIAPMGAVYQPDSPGTLTDQHPVVCAFRGLGWRWGGNFRHIKDYHHFEK
jgi:peptidoglycan LD-endopeptidase CwlK